MLRKWLIAAFALASALAGAQTTLPILQPHVTFVDAAGLPCTGCKLYSYIAGSTTPLATYTDASGVTPNTNPVVLDVAGGAQIWLGTTSYKFILKTALGSTIWTVDNVSGANATQYLPLSGGTISGNLTVSGTLTASLTGHASLDVPLSGGTMTGPLTVPTINSLPAQEYKTTSANPSQLSNLWRYLHAAPNYQGGYPSAGMDVIFPNDSLWEGDWTNSTGCGGNTAVPQYSQNRQAEQIRISLQSQYGYGGTGLMPVVSVANCTTLANPELYTSSPSTLVTTGIIGPQYGTEYSLVQMSSGQVITWNGGQLPYTFVRTYCADNASSNPITVAIDGVSVGNACGTHNGSPIARAVTSTPNQPYTNHTATFTCATGPCYMYGAEGRPSTGAGNAGVRVHNVATGGAPSGWFAGHTEFEDLITNGFGNSANLIIYAMGTNDANLGVPLATYTANFQAYFAHELAKLPETPVIVIYRPGLDIAPSQTYFAALTAYGYANNMLVIDQTNRWGTGCTTGCWWLGNDNLHFNDGANLDAAHTILNALTDVPHGQPLSPLFGDTGLNAGMVRLTAPPLTGFIGLPGFVWDGVPGVPGNKGIYAWQTGNGLNLPGEIGLADPNYSGVVWGTNANNDFCIHTPRSGADFSTCAGKHFRVVMATGEVDTGSNVLDDGTGGASFVGPVNANNGFKVGSAAPNGHTLCGNGTAYVDSASCGGSGVPSINASSGAFTFTGPGVSCTGTTCTFSGTGSGVTSVAMTVPSWLSVAGSPVTTSGTLAVTANSQSANLVLASPNGSSGAPTFRAIATADLPAVITATQFQTNVEFSNGTCTTAKTIDPANGNRQKVTLTNAATCALTFTQPASGTATVQLKITQSAVSTFNGGISGCKWPGGVVPTITQTTGAVDMLSVYLDGTTAYCQIAQAFS